jgi:hypothetical protein
MLATSAQGTVLTFDIDVTRPDADLAFDPSYGDRVTSLLQGVAAYSLGSEGFTPNVTVSYTDGQGRSNYVRAARGYGDLVNVIYNNSRISRAQVQFDADPGYAVVLYGFDLAGAPNTDYIIPSLSVAGSAGTLFSQSNFLVRGASGTPRHTSFDFANGLRGGETLTISLEFAGRAAFGSGIGFDNVRFGQTPLAPPPPPEAGVPEPATWAMLIMGFAGMGGLLRKTARGVAVGQGLSSEGARAGACRFACRAGTGQVRA